METDSIFPFVLLLVTVGMILGVGILVLDIFGDAAKTDGTASLESIVIAYTGTTTNDEVSAVAFFGNATLNTTTITATNSYVNFTEGGVISVNRTHYPNDTYTITYTYDKDSEATTTTTSVVSALGSISSTWLPLIVTIAMLAIILTLVIRSFAQKR